MHCREIYIFQTANIAITLKLTYIYGQQKKNQHVNDQWSLLFKKLLKIRSRII